MLVRILDPLTNESHLEDVYDDPTITLYNQDPSQFPPGILTIVREGSGASNADWLADKARNPQNWPGFVPPPPPPSEARFFATSPETRVRIDPAPMPLRAVLSETQSPAATLQQASLSMASIFGVDLFKTGAAFIAGGPGGAAAAAAAGIAGRLAKRSMTPADPVGGGALVSSGGGFAACPPGYRTDSNGVCRRTGIGGVLERVLPGDIGLPGSLQNRDPQQMGLAVAGAMGIPALVPIQVGTIEARDGMHAILKCNRGMVLGKDDLCYVKGSIPRGWRKWPPGARPPISAGDAVHMRKAAAAKNRVKKLARKVGCFPKVVRVAKGRK